MSWHLRPELLSEEFSRSSGPGGQNVNRRETRVEATYRFADDPGLADAQKERIRMQNASALVGADAIRISVSTERSQGENRRIARERLTSLIKRALHEPKKRKKTKPSRAAKEKRLKSKKQRSEAKKLRQKPRGY